MTDKTFLHFSVLEINRCILINTENDLLSNRIRKLIKLYQHWRNKQKEQSLSLFKFSQRILYILAKYMIFSNFNDSSTVVKLLNCIFENDKDFSKIIFWNVLYLKPLTKYEIMKFCLQHSYHQKVLFSGRRLPLTKTMYSQNHNVCLIDSAVLLNEPVVLYQMLRFGAFLSYVISPDEEASEATLKVALLFAYDFIFYTGLGVQSKVDLRHKITTLHSNHFPAFQSPWKYLTLILAVQVIQNLNPKTLPNQELKLNPKMLEMYNKSVTCCALLLRDYPQSSLNFCCFLRLDPLLQPEDNKNYVKKFNDNILEGFKSHFLEPIKLKHGCRFCIRKLLNENWLLPSGIYDLPIPECLKLYLDLQYD